MNEGIKLRSIIDKIAELKNEIADQEKDIENRKAKLGAALGQLAMAKTKEAEASVEHQEKSIERISKSLEQNRMAVFALELERESEEIRLARKDAEEIPGELEGLAKDYNTLLDESISLYDAISVLHRKLFTLQENFYSLSNRRSNSLSKIGKIEPLTLKEGLGKFAFMGSPWGESFTTPSEIKNFFAMVESYKRKLSDYEKFKEANANYEKDLETTRNMDKQKSGPFRSLVSKMLA